jgi:hypothetical protein
MQDGPLATAAAEAVTAEEASVVAVSTVVDSTAEALPVVASMVGVLGAALSTAVTFVVAILVGATGAGTGGITDSLMMSSSVATVIHGGGTIRTDTTVTAITRTLTMDTVDTPTMDTAGSVTTVAGVMDTAMALDRGISGVEHNAAIAD